MLKPILRDDQWAKLEGHITKPEGAPTLVPETDRRQAIPTRPEEVFSKIEPASPALDFLD